MTFQPPLWLDRHEYPFEPRVIECGGHRLSVVDEGEGPVVLFVHGTPAWSFQWRHAIRVLRGHCRVIAPDLPGFGLSPPAAPESGYGYTPAEHAAVLTALIRSLDVPSLTLCVHDFGTPIGLRAALDAGTPLRAMVAANGWMWDLRGENAAAEWGAWMFSTPLGRLLYQGLSFSVEVMVPGSFGDRSKLTKAIHDHYRGPFPHWAARYPTWVLARELFGSSDFYASLWNDRARLTDVPACLLWGMKDFAFGRTHLDRLRSVFTQVEVHEFPGAGHFPMEEEPEAFTQALVQFIHSRVG